MLVKRILKKFEEKEDNRIDSLQIADLKQSTEVTNEALDCLIKRDTSDEGYWEFIISDWYTLATPLEDTILDRTLEKLANVEVF